LGSGAGLPGLVLALARPDVQLVLIEPMERRVAWLQEESDRLGLTNVEVVRARAEEARVAPLNQITARAVKAFSGLIPMAVPLLAPGGELIFLKGASAQAEIEAAAKPIRRFHLHNVEVITLGEPWGTESTNVIRASLVTEVAPG
jgi:16S rRNA (guanine527-N7)-methyltransferase